MRNKKTVGSRFYVQATYAVIQPDGLAFNYYFSLKEAKKMADWLNEKSGIKPEEKGRR